MNTFLIVVNMMLPAAHHTQRNDVVATREGLIAVTVTQMPQSRKGRNAWSDAERAKTGHLFFKDEGLDGSLPLVDCRKGGL